MRERGAEHRRGEGGGGREGEIVRERERERQIQSGCERAECREGCRGGRAE